MKIESLQKIKDIHKGKTILVCGSGGSLLDVDTKKLHTNIIVMCCNSATYHFKKFDYGVFTDGTANYSNWYLNLTKKKCTIINCNQEIPKIKRNTIYFEKNFDNWKFEETDTKVIGGYDVIHCAVHIAWMMGASQIILAGVDLKHMTASRKYAYDQSVNENIPQALLETLQQSLHANDSLFDGYLGASLGGWEKIDKWNTQLRIKTISKDTNLKIYDYTDVNSLY
jgi:uncharacterized Rossmann fold enzyme